jgi:hypothetical protein
VEGNDTLALKGLRELLPETIQMGFLHHEYQIRPANVPRGDNDARVRLPCGWQGDGPVHSTDTKKAAECGMSVRLSLTRGNRIYGAMFEWFGKMLTRLGSTSSQQSDVQQTNQLNTATEDGQHKLEGKPADTQAERNTLGSENLGRSAASPEGPTSVPIMLEILKLLSRIEYGLDEQQIAEALAISAEVVLANCQALEQEMLIHHHDTLAEWFIGQRGLVFLRLHSDPG